jgi:hypothetical protein
VARESAFERHARGSRPSRGSPASDSPRRPIGAPSAVTRAPRRAAPKPFGRLAGRTCSGDELHVSRWYQVDRDRILQTANAVRKKNHEPESDPPLDSGLDGQSSLGRTRVGRFAKRNGSGVWRASRSSRLLPVTRHAPLAPSSTRSLPPSSISCSPAFSPTSSSCARAFGRTRRGRSPRSRRRRTPRTSPPPRRTRTPSPRAPPRAPSYPRRRCCSRRTGRRWT